MEASTIAAIASAPGSARRGVLRLSGPGSRAIVEQLFRPSSEVDRQGGRAAKGIACSAEPPVLRTQRGFQAGRLHDGIGEQPCRLLWMPGPASYTREDVAELHLPGAQALLQCALRAVLRAGARAAEPGEFTRRAFHNGRLDLSRAEGVLALVEARTEAERRAATKLLGGGLARRVEGVRDVLEELRALTEASLDFDESDTGHVPLALLQDRIDRARARLEDALSWEEARQAPSAVARVVLHGAPNAGKSSLWNALVASSSRAEADRVGRAPGAPGVPGAQGGAAASAESPANPNEPRALVAAHAGTTRDVNEAALFFEGTPAVLVDGPGWDARWSAKERATRAAGAHADDPDVAAQRFAEAERAAADLILWVIDAERAAETAEPLLARELSNEAAALDGSPVVVVWSRIDRLRAPSGPSSTVSGALEGYVPCSVSARTGEGLDGLRKKLSQELARQAPEARPGLGRELFERHRVGLEEAREALQEGASALAAGAPLDLVAEAFRLATAALDAILGHTSPEDLLDRIFARFCIGK